MNISYGRLGCAKFGNIHIYIYIYIYLSFNERLSQGAIDALYIDAGS